ncbi:MAG TPA: glycosyltransferase family 2 protein, partial [Candidatus Omnitrophota bacterium]|nr:glycosyltransferase family 2 protein [Candidatus Omnitrophota bacterium]
MTRTAAISSVSVIVVNFNGKQYLKDCFDSLLSLAYPQDKIELIMVDNASEDSSVDYVRSQFPSVRVILSDINNYCHANNLGIRASKGDFIALVNNDVTVDRTWLSVLIDAIHADDAIGAVTGKVLFKDGLIQSAGHTQLPLFYWEDRGFKQADRGQFNKAEDVASISHCAALYRRSCIDDIGLLDEEFIMYLEDVDYSLRARKKGWRLVFVPDGIARHLYHGSIDDAQVIEYCEKNRLLLLAKHYPEKLAENLFGSGYFTALNGRGDLIRNLNAAFSALLRYHSLDDVRMLLPGLLDSMNRVVDTEKDFLLKRSNELKARDIEALESAISQTRSDLELRIKDLARLKDALDRAEGALEEYKRDNRMCKELLL